MSHFAKIENDIVVDVIVASQSFVDNLDGEWIQTSYNTHGNTHSNGKEPLRGNYASKGFTYDRLNDAFYSPQPYPSWNLNQSTWLWEAPVPMPDDGNKYIWREDLVNWEMIPTEEGLF